MNFENPTFDETNWGWGCYFDALGRLQKEQYDKKEKEKAKRTQVDFVSGSVLKRPAIAPAVELVYLSVSLFVRLSEHMPDDHYVDGGQTSLDSIQYRLALVVC